MGKAKQAQIAPSGVKGMMAERMAKRLKELREERQAAIDRKVEEGWRPGLDGNGRPILIEPKRGKMGSTTCPTCRRQVGVGELSRYKVMMGSEKQPLATYDIVACNPREARDMAVATYLAGLGNNVPITLPVYIVNA